VPWRFLDAGRLRASSISSLPASKNLHTNGLMHRQQTAPWFDPKSALPYILGRDRLPRGMTDATAGIYLTTCCDAQAVSFGPILLQNDFWCWNEEQFSRPRIESGILIHRTGHSDSIIAEFPWPERSSGTFATISAYTGHPAQTRRTWSASLR
jgi:hypothetical protein